jgi:LPS export ABC transporter protein LptC
MFYQGGGVRFDPARIEDVLPQNVDMKLTGVNYTEVTHGRQEWTMKAATLHYFKSRNLIVLDQVNATFYTEDGPMRITGDKAYYDKEAQTVRLVGDINAWDVQGNRLSTREMRYNVPSGVLIAPGDFRLHGPKLNLEGHGLTVDTRNDSFKVLSRPNLLLKSNLKLM